MTSNEAHPQERLRHVNLDLDLESARIASTFTELAAAAESIARGGDFDEFVHGLTFVIAATGSRRDVREMAQMRGKLARLVDRMRELEGIEEPLRVEFLTRFVCGLMESLEQIETTTRIQLEARSRDADVRTLRERVIAELSARGRARPSDLAKALGTSMPQISRALRELDGDHRIRQATAPLLRGDRRSRWYELTQGDGVVMDQDQRAQQKAAPGISFIPRGLEHEVLALMKCAPRPLRRDDLRHLTTADKDSFGRCVDVLLAGGFLEERDDAYSLTERGQKELHDLTERGLSETVEDVELRVPNNFNGVVALVGAPGSGKRAVGLEFARRRGWPHLSMGAFIRDSAPEGSTEAALAEYGPQMIARLGWSNFMQELLAWKGFGPGSGPIVIDGSTPYPEGLEALRELYPAAVIPVFLDAPDWLRRLRHQQEQELGAAPEAAPLDVSASGFAQPPGFTVVVSVQG